MYKLEFVLLKIIFGQLISEVSHAYTLQVCLRF
jgi:hypothetical protein